MIYFICPDGNDPVGGNKQIYRHAGILASSGMDAYVLHSRRGFSCTWFSHSTPVAHLPAPLRHRVSRAAGRVVKRLHPGRDLNIHAGRKIVLNTVSGRQVVALNGEDVVVTPEYYGSRLTGAFSGVKVIILNQNAHYTFRNWGFNAPAHSNIYEQSSTLGAVCVSLHNQKYLEKAFPALRIARAINGIDPSVFHIGDPNREKIISFMPRKRSDHLEQVIQILHMRGALSGWRVLPIAGLSESQVSDVLRRTSVFLSDCRDEGFGLPPLEAAISGALIVGYRGYAAAEYFTDEFGWPVMQDDVLDFVAQAERAVSFAEAGGDRAATHRQRVSESLAQRYSLQNEVDSVLAAYAHLLRA